MENNYLQTKSRNEGISFLLKHTSIYTQETVKDLTSDVKSS